MKQFFNKALLGLAGLGMAATGLVGCYEGEIYNAGAPDDLQQRIDSIAAAKAAAEAAGGNENALEGMMEDVYTIGATDFSSGWWNQFSKYYVIKDGEKWNAVFNLNINPKAANTYKNFALILTNDVERSGNGYTEYGAIRYDNQPSGNSEWGDYIDRSCVESTLTFDTDTDSGVDKLGGKVTLTVDRSVAGQFQVTITNGTVTKTYTQKTSLANLNSDESNTNMRCFLVPEGSYIDFKETNIEPVGGCTSANDKQPVSMKLNNVPLNVILDESTTLEDIVKNVTATVEFEEGVTKEVTYESLKFAAIPDLSSVGTKTIVATYSTTFKGEGTTQAVMATSSINVITAEMAITMQAKLNGKAFDLNCLNIVGNGSIIEDAKMGMIFRNVPGDGEINKNYLEIPASVVNACAEAKCITLSFKVRNYGKATLNQWSPMFTINNGVDWTFGQLRCGGQLIVNQNGYLDGTASASFDGAKWISGNDDWHDVTASFYEDGMTLFIDGELIGENLASGENTIMGFINDLGNEAKTIKLGGGQLQSWADADQPLDFADIEISTKKVTSKDVIVNSVSVSLNGVDTKIDKSAIKGTGEFDYDAELGAIYRNIPGEGEINKNYLEIPASVVNACAEAKCITVSFKVRNYGKATLNQWSPMFTINNGVDWTFGQLRCGGQLIVNQNGYLDGTASASFDGAKWISGNDDWHDVVASIYEDGLTLYIDGELIGEDVASGDNTVMGFINDLGNEAKTIKLGGGQLQSWADADQPLEFAQIKVSNQKPTK